VNIQRPPIPDHPYDVIIIGGGVNGAAIARECALGGKRTLLLEQHDFGSGTSSRATRIIHGGLRYLEHGELALVRESLRERELLLRTKPALVHPLRFILAMPRHNNPFSLRGPLALRTGLAFYRLLSGKRSEPSAAKQDIATLGHLLDSGQRWTLLDYEDAQCEFPERLIADWVVEAAGAGAVVRNHIEVLSVEVLNGCATGVRTRDRFTREESRFTATWIINATGPWADHITGSSAIKSGRMIGGVRGSHILVPRFAGAPSAAVYTEATDGRAIFIIPWNGQTLVGTTEVADDRPSGTAPSAGEVQYLWRSFARVFPKSGLSPSDIIACYAGIRPLPYVAGKDLSGTTRRHFLRVHSDDGAQGLISVIGGKLTTATSLARDCARKTGLRPSSTTPPVVVPVQTESDGSVEELYAGSNYSIGQAVHAFNNEFAVTLGDVLLRRVPAALSADWTNDHSRTASQRIGRALGWSEAKAAAAREDFELERNAFLIKPADVKAF
jgi:glycerol-3-phosphate dehydrogenase